MINVYTIDCWRRFWDVCVLSLSTGVYRVRLSQYCFRQASAFDHIVFPLDVRLCFLVYCFFQLVSISRRIKSSQI